MCFLSSHFLTLSKTGNYLQIASSYWLLNRNIARNVAREMFLCAMASKCVAVSKPCNFTGNLCRNKIAGQIAEQVAYSHSALILLTKT